MKAQLGLLVVSMTASTFAAPLSLYDCVVKAMDQNPDLEAAAFRADAAAAAVGEARSSWYPDITLSGSYARTDNPPQAFFMNLNQRQADLTEDFNEPEDTDNFRTSLGFRMLLADAGQRSLKIDMSKLSEAASQDMLNAARNELVFQVTRAYYSAGQAAAMVTVREETISSIEENLRVAQERYAAGSALKSDVLNLEVQSAEARDAWIRALNGFKLAIAALNTAIGENVADESNLDLTVENNLIPPLEQVDLNEADQRPEQIGTQRQAAAAGLEFKRTRRDRFPRLVAFGSMDWDSDSLNGMEDSYIVGAALELDLFTGFRKDAETAGAMAREAEARARADSLRNQLRFDLQRAHLNSLEAWSRIDVAAKSLASANEVHRITRERYEEGSADITELMSAQTGQTASRTRDVAARFDYLIATADLTRARGLFSRTE